MCVCVCVCVLLLLTPVMRVCMHRQRAQAPANRSSHGSGDAANAALGAAGGDGSEQLEDILLRRGGKEESTGYQGEES